MYWWLKPWFNLEFLFAGKPRHSISELRSPVSWQWTDLQPHPSRKVQAIPRGPFCSSFPPGGGQHQSNLCSENGRYPLLFMH